MPPLDPLTQDIVDARAALQLWRTVLVHALAAAFANNFISSGSPIASRLRDIAETRRELLAFAANPHGHSNLGLLCDFANVERKAIALSIKTAAANDWPEFGIFRRSRLADYVTTSGKLFYCDQPCTQYSIVDFCAATLIDPSMTYYWR